MGISNVFQNGKSGMTAARASIATAGHNIANATTEGYSRQRVMTEAQVDGRPGKDHIGAGTKITRVERLNDEYLEKQIRNGSRELAHNEEKDLVLRQAEDIFNEMGGDGLNRLVASFFNEFRKLSNEPENEAIRQTVREASQSMVNDFHRLRENVEDVRKHIDARLEGYTTEVNTIADNIRDLNERIRQVEIAGGSPNDLLDQRDQGLKKLGAYMNLSSHKDNFGNVIVNVQGVGPLVAGPETQKFSVFRTPADDQGKPDNALDLKTSGSAQSVVTHTVKGGKIGALLEVRDQTLSTVLERLDEMAATMTSAVNEIHRQGVNRDGETGVLFFQPMPEGAEGNARAAEFIQLSDAVRDNVNNIATAVEPDSPGDNRVALAIAGLQGKQLLNHGRSTIDQFYNSIVSDVGLTTAKNRAGMNQQKDIVTQLEKMREQISGVSIDEETANIMQFQQIFGASARVIQVADECLKTVLDLKR